MKPLQTVTLLKPLLKAVIMVNQLPFTLFQAYSFKFTENGGSLSSSSSHPSLSTEQCLSKITLLLKIIMFLVNDINNNRQKN